MSNIAEAPIHAYRDSYGRLYKVIAVGKDGQEVELPITSLSIDHYARDRMLGMAKLEMFAMRVKIHDE